MSCPYLCIEQVGEQGCFMPISSTRVVLPSDCQCLSGLAWKTRYNEGAFVDGKKVCIHPLICPALVRYGNNILILIETTLLKYVWTETCRICCAYVLNTYLIHSLSYAD